MIEKKKIAFPLIWLIPLSLFLAGCSTVSEIKSTQDIVLPTQLATLAATATHIPTPVPEAVNTLPPAAPPALTPEPGQNDLSNYYGGLVITLDYVGQTISMKPGQGFLMRLGEEFTWTVQVMPQDVLTENRNVAVEAGEQGVFIARKDGKAELTAIGEPACRLQDPPCGRPSVQFVMHIIVD
jgi:hypothetical protein